MDLKKAVAETLDRLIAPIRKHFKEDTEALQLETEVKKFIITR